MLTIAGKTLKRISAVPLVFTALMSATAFAQAPPYFAPQDLDRLVQRFPQRCLAPPFRRLALKVIANDAAQRQRGFERWRRRNLARSVETVTSQPVPETSGVSKFVSLCVLDAVVHEMTHIQAVGEIVKVRERIGNLELAGRLRHRNTT